MPLIPLFAGSGGGSSAIFILIDSPFIDADGEITTYQLTPPSGKTTSDFGGGRIQDDENPGDAVDLDADEYREDEWCIQATSYGMIGDQYEFRVVTDTDVEMDTYTEYPKWTLNEQPMAPILSLGV